jgi:predicted phosphodiesterase
MTPAREWGGRRDSRGGSTHVPQVERFQHLWVLNPGSPTERRRQPVHTMLVLHLRGSRLNPELVTLSTSGV